MAKTNKCTQNETKCRACGSTLQQRYEGEMYAGSFILDGKRMEIRKEPRKGYFDPIHLDIITQYFDGGLWRVWPSSQYYSKGNKKLHRAVWEDAFGEIPKSCHIHHKDSNPANNALENLECIDASEHLSNTWNKHKEKLSKGFSEKAREKAAEWHKSEAGRLWHSRQAKRSKNWTKWKRETRECQNCGNEYQGLIRNGANVQKFCHPNCKAAFYRKRKAIEG